MKYLEIGEIVYLDDNLEYVVSSIAKKDNNVYAFLTTIDEPYKIKFVKEKLENNNLILEPVTKKEEKQELLILFKKEIGNIKI